MQCRLPVNEVDVLDASYTWYERKKDSRLLHA
jgi:hypothetical protein